MRNPQNHASVRKRFPANGMFCQKDIYGVIGKRLLRKEDFMKLVEFGKSLWGAY